MSDLNTHVGPKNFSDKFALNFTKFLRFIPSLKKDTDIEQLFWKQLQLCLEWLQVC